MESEKRRAALNRLAATGMWRSTYSPPMVRLLWLFGVDAPPPHFGTFGYNAVLSGASFAIGFSLAIRLIEGSRPGKSLWALILEVVLASIFFGWYMARFYADGRRKYGLPSWSEFHP